MLCFSCNKDDNTNGNSYPAILFLYFEILKPDGTHYEDATISISSEMKMENGQIIPFGNTIIWDKMGKSNIASNASNKTLFGVGPCGNCEDIYGSGLIFAAGWESGDVNPDESWLNNRFYLLKYSESEIDTLRIKDELKPGFDRDFKFYINGEEKEILGDERFGETSPSYIQIQK